MNISFLTITNVSYNLFGEKPLNDNEKPKKIDTQRFFIYGYKKTILCVHKTTMIAFAFSTMDRRCNEYEILYACGYKKVKSYIKKKSFEEYLSSLDKRTYSIRTNKSAMIKEEVQYPEYTIEYSFSYGSRNTFSIDDIFQRDHTKKIPIDVYCEIVWDVFERIAKKKYILPQLI